MLLHLEQPYVAVLICTGDTHVEPVVEGFPDQKGKKLSEPDVEIALVAIAREHGWFPCGGGELICPRCGVEIAKIALSASKKAFDERRDEAELETLARGIETLDAYLGKFDTDRKKAQPDLPFDEQAPSEGDGDEEPDDEQEEPEPEEEPVGATTDD